MYKLASVFLVTSIFCTTIFAENDSCTTKDGLKINVSDTAVSGNYRIECQKYWDTTKLVPIACRNNGHDLLPDEQYKDDKFVYKCSKVNDDELTLNAVGCVGNQGEVVQFESIVSKDKFLYKCRSNGTTGFLEPVACLNANMKRLEIGDTTIVDGKYWAKCERNGDELQVKIKGCVDDKGNMVREGDTYHLEGYVMKCMRNDDDTIGRKTVGCLEKKTQDEVVEHYPGQQWTEADANVVEISYQKECQQNSSGQIQSKVVKCQFQDRKDSDNTSIQVGCMRKVDKRLMVCSKTDQGAQARFLDNAALNDETRAIDNDKVEYC